MWRRQCVKTIERTSTKVCCSVHMLQCLISRSGETWLSEKKMMNTFTLGNLLQWRMTFPGEENRGIRLARRAYGRHSDIGKERRTVCLQTKDVLSMHVAGVDICKWEMGFDLEDRKKVNGSTGGYRMIDTLSTNRERIRTSFSWATDSREQCNLEKYRTWNDSGKVTWLQEEMTDRTSWWSNGSQRDVLGKEQTAEAQGCNGASQRWLRLGMNTAHTQGEMKANSLPRFKLVQLASAQLPPT